LESIRKAGFKKARLMSPAKGILFWHRRKGIVYSWLKVFSREFKANPGKGKARVERVKFSASPPFPALLLLIERNAELNFVVRCCLVVFPAV
jgi:hypothetical protein